MFTPSARPSQIQLPTNQEIYTESWESLSKHEQAPEWFADAKFGIYFHWGPYSVPAKGSEWYPHYMYYNDHHLRAHHEKTYGDPSIFGYHDFIPMFNAKNFDPKDWVELFHRAGAKFAGPVAQHHDGFAMWASKINPWNVQDLGPKRDITGELANELKSRGMKLITTFHHARNLQRNADNPDEWEGWNSHFPYHPDFATSSTDQELSKLYGNIPADEFYIYWMEQVKEVIDNYSPDVIWFDSWLNLIPEKYRLKLTAYYLNNAQKRQQEVVIGYKQTDYPKSVGVLDIEQGGKRDLSDTVWLTDVTLSNRSWSYVNGQTYKSAKLVLRNMIDVWSKNGIVLLNVSPRADGTIPLSQREVLHQIGDWLQDFGEAVYNTRPHSKYGEGPAKIDHGRHGGQSATVEYTADDIRFTVSKDYKTMYLLFLGKPEIGKRLNLRRTLAVHHYPTPSPIKRITTLGSEVEVPWELTSKDFFITIPDTVMNELATVFKFELN